MPAPSDPVLDRVLFSTFGDDQPRDDHGRFTSVSRTGPEHVEATVPPWRAADRPKWLSAAGDAWNKSLTEDERKEIGNYSSTSGEPSFKQINEQLRASGAAGEPPTYYGGEIAAIDRAVRKFPAHAQPLTSYRALTTYDDDKCHAIEEGLLAALETGEPVTFHGFTSSSIDPQSALFFADTVGHRSGKPRPVFEITSPRGAYIRPASETPDEHEIIHTHGERFRVTGVRDVAFKKANGYTKVHRTYTLEAVPEPPPPLNVAGFAAEPNRDASGRFASGDTGPRPDLHPEAVASVSQGDGHKIQTPHGYIDYRHNEGVNEIWWVESHKKGHGSELVDAMQQNHPAESVAWGVTTGAGKGLRDKWHAAHPEVNQENGAFEGQFDPSGDNYGESDPEDEDDDDFDDEDDDQDQERLFSFDPDKHPRDAHGLFLPADGGVIEPLPEVPGTGEIASPPELEAASKKWAAKLTAGEKAAVGEYTNDAYLDLNPLLRASPDGADLAPAERRLVKRLDAAIRKYPPFPEPVTSYRGLSVTSDKKLARLDQAFNAALATGEPITLNGFSSADIDPARAASRAGDGRPVLEIRSRRGAYVRAASSCQGEHEVLHTHGEKFHVVEVKTVKYRMRWGGLIPRKTYVLEAVGDAPAAQFGWEDEARDEKGQWTSGGAASGGLDLGGDDTPAASARPVPGDGPLPLTEAVLNRVPTGSNELKARASAWESDLTQNQKNAVEEYTADNFDPINRKLRACPQTLDCLRHVRDDAARLQAAIQKFPPHDPPLTTYRGVKTGRPGVLGQAKLAEIENGLKAALATGHPIQMDGFQSSTVDPSFAAKWSTGTDDHGLMMEIKSPRGAYIPSLSVKSHEEEVLHAHGEKYTVTGVRRQLVEGEGGKKVTRTIYTLEAVAENPPPVPFSADFGWEAEKHPKDERGRWASAPASGPPEARPYSPHAPLADDAVRPEDITPADVPPALQSRADQWSSDLTPQEATAVESYTLMGYLKLNSELGASGGDPDALDPKLRTMHDALVSAIEKFGPIDPPVTVWRGACLRKVRADAFMDACEAARQTGGTVSLPCFQSCSFNPKVAGYAAPDGDQEHPDNSGKMVPRRDLMLEIRARTGAWVGGTEHGCETENELIAPPGVKYTVAGVKTVPFAVEGGQVKMRKVVQLVEVDPVALAVRAVSLPHARVLDRVLFAVFGFDPDQPRDDHGRWGGAATVTQPEPPPLGPASWDLPPGMTDRAEKWEAKLPWGEKQSLSHYASSGFDPMNHYLRAAARGARPEGLSAGEAEGILDHVYALDSALRKSPPAAEPFKTWRGVSSSNPAKVATLRAGFDAALATGEAVTFDGFSSSSLDPPFAARWAKPATDGGKVVLELTGRRGVYTAVAAGNLSEMEVLHTHGERFKVVGVRDQKYVTPYGESVTARTYSLEEVDEAPPLLPPRGTAAFEFDPGQPRAANGQWGDGGAAPVAAPVAAPAASAPLVRIHHEDVPAALTAAGKDWGDSIPSAQRHAIGRYTHTDYNGMNKLLRATAGGELSSAPTAGYSEELFRMARHIDRAIRTFPPHDPPLTTYRGMSSDYKEKIETFRKGFDAALASGEPVKFDGFSSSSVNPYLAAQWAAGAADQKGLVLEIKSPRGAYLAAGVSVNKREMEVLHTHGERYKVVGVRDQEYVNPTTRGKYTTRTYTLEAVPEEPAPFFPPAAGAEAKFDWNPDLHPRGMAGRFGPGGSVSPAPAQEAAAGPDAPAAPPPVATTPAPARVYPMGDPRRDYGDSAARPGVEMKPEHTPPDLKNRSDEWERTRLSRKARLAVNGYVRHHYTELNRAMLAAGGDITRLPDTEISDIGMSVREMGTRMMEAFRSHGPLAEPLTCWRTMNLKPARMTEFLAAAEVAVGTGDPIQFPVFGSATINPKFALDNSDPNGAVTTPVSPGVWKVHLDPDPDTHKHAVLLEIRARSGMYVGGSTVPVFRWENEVIQPPQARYKVRGWKDVTFGTEKRRVLQLDELPPDPAQFYDPKGRDGDLDPEGHWTTISGNRIHITGDGEIDAGGHPALRKVLDEKASIPSKLTGDPRHDYGDSFRRPAFERRAEHMPKALRERTRAWGDALSPETRTSIKSYMGYGYKPINRALRDSGGRIDALSDEVAVPGPDGYSYKDPPKGLSWRKVAENLQEAFRSHGPLREPLTSWRAMSLTPERMTAFLDAADAAQATGGEITFPVFGSATLNPEHAEDMTHAHEGYTTPVRPGVQGVSETRGGPASKHRVLLEIRSKTGMYIGGLPDMEIYSKYENELLQSPAARYRVKGWREVMFGDEDRRVLQLEEVDPPAPSDPAAKFADPRGAKGDLDPDGKWLTIAHNKCHIDSNGELDAGGPAPVREALAKRKAKSDPIAEPPGTSAVPPHELTEDEFRANPPDGFVYDHTLPHEADMHSNPPKITVGPKFFAHPPETRERIVTHEIGHDLSDKMLDDGTAFTLVKQGAYTRIVKGDDGEERVGMVHDNTPGENAAESYSLLVHDSDEFRKDFPLAHRATAEAALRHGYPVPKASLAHHPDLLKHQADGTPPPPRKDHPAANAMHGIKDDRQAQLVQELVALGKLQYDDADALWHLNGEAAPTAKAVVEGPGGSGEKTTREIRAASAAASGGPPDAASLARKRAVERRVSNLRTVAPWLHDADFSDDQPRDEHGRWASAGGERVAATWAADLTPQERSAASDYTGEAYYDTNKHLRAGGAPREADRALQSAILKYPPHDPPLTSYRGLSVSSPHKMAAIREGLDAAVASGEPLRLDGFNSASLDPQFAARYGKTGRGGVVLEMKSPRGAFIDPVSQFGNQKEVLHPHGDHFKVTGVRTVEFPADRGDPAVTRTVYTLEAAAPPAAFAVEPPAWTLADWPALDPAAFTDPKGAKGDLDPDGHWRTVSGNAIHITADGEIDAGGHPVLRQILAEKAGLHPKGTKAAGSASAASAGGLDALGTPEYRERVRNVLSPYKNYPPVSERLGLALDAAGKAAWKARVTALAAAGHHLTRKEIDAELAFPGQNVRGERLRNFIATGDPERGPAPLPPPGEHPLEKGAKAVGAWTPHDHPDDESFVAAHPDMKYVKPEHLAAVRTVFPGASLRDLAALAGWQPGDDAPRVREGNASGAVALRITTNEWVGTERECAKLVSIQLRPTDSGPDIHIDEYSVGGSFQGKGAATRAIANLLAVGRRLGASHASLSAVGYGPQSWEKENRRGGVANGYYTWPMLGFDRTFDEDERGHLQALPEPFRAAKRLSELLSTPGGPAAWKRHGWSVSCDFPLNRDDTPGAKVLANYLAAKAAKRAAEAPK